MKLNQPARSNHPKTRAYTYQKKRVLKKILGISSTKKFLSMEPDPYQKHVSFTTHEFQGWVNMGNGSRRITITGD